MKEQIKTVRVGNSPSHFDEEVNGLIQKGWELLSVDANPYKAPNGAPLTEQIAVLVLR